MCKLHQRKSFITSKNDVGLHKTKNIFAYPRDCADATDKSTLLHTNSAYFLTHLSNFQNGDETKT